MKRRGAARREGTGPDARWFAGRPPWVPGSSSSAVWPTGATMRGSLAPPSLPTCG